jgi:actin
LDYDDELSLSLYSTEMEKSYELPDGQIVNIGSERFRCPEVMFRPSLIGSELPGVHQILARAITKCDIDMRRDLYANIVLSGSNCAFPGFADRLEKEMIDFAPFTIRTKIINPPEKKFSVWIGASILSSLSLFQQKWISKASNAIHFRIELTL